MPRWLKISLPITVPSPTSERVTKSAMSEVKSSGDDAPAAISVAPATSSGMRHRSHSRLSAGTK